MKQFSLILHQITIITILINITRCFEEDSNIGNITIRDGDYLADKFKISSTNKNNLKINKKNKLCIVKNIEDFDNLCKPFVKIFYDKWVKI